MLGLIRMVPIASNPKGAGSSVVVSAYLLVMFPTSLFVRKRFLWDYLLCD